MKRVWFGTFALLLAAASASEAQTRMIIGRVVDSTMGQSVYPGLVRVLGTPIQAQVRVDGTFIVYVPIREVTLSFESTGYEKKESRVQAFEETVVMNVRRDVFQLSRLVVTGQATGVERRNLSNSVAEISATELSRTPAPSVDDAMRGKVNGASITSNSGAPGGGIKLRLRGVSTILGNSDPLFILDGVVVSNATIPGGVNAVTQGERGAISSNQEDALNRIADINPNDIESIEILKGASASAMYGSKASNGVVIIRTKHGRYSNGN